MSAEVKECEWCGDKFTQAAAPKATQIYCSWICHVEATREGVL